MTTAQRAYINKSFNQYVDDECLQFRSVPMAVVNQILQPKSRKMSDFTGVKRIFNNVPARPINLNALATSIARMNGMDYSKVESISKQIGDEEVKLINEFVKGNKDPFQIPNLGIEIQGPKLDQQPDHGGGIIISNNEREYFKDVPKSESNSKQVVKLLQKSQSNSKEVQLLLGDESMTYNTPSMNISMGGSKREYLKRINNPKAVEFYKTSQFIDLVITHTQKMASKRTKEIMGRTNKSGFVNLSGTESEITKYLSEASGIDLSGTTVYPQVGHTTQRMDAIVGSARIQE